MGSYIPFLIIIFLCIILPARRRKKAAAVYMTKIKRKKLDKEERTKMYELLKRFIGKKCHIVTMNSNEGILGTITEVQDNWVVIEATSNTLDTINIDYITRITEWPSKEKKKK